MMLVEKKARGWEVTPLHKAIDRDGREVEVRGTTYRVRSLEQFDAQVAALDAQIERLEARRDFLLEMKAEVQTFEDDRTKE